MNELTLTSESYPNPSNDLVWISFSLPSESHLTLDVYNERGEIVAMPIKEFKTAGAHIIELKTSGLANGLYIYRIRSKHGTVTQKLVIAH